MKTRRVGVVFVLLIGSVWSYLGGNVAASDPVGLYAVIDKIALEPAQGSPERIQIWGAFALADTRSPDDYAQPQTGYLYYRCASGQEATCRNEWNDLKSVAGKGIGVGFGGRYIATGRVR